MIILSAKLATVMPSLECSVYIKELPDQEKMLFFIIFIHSNIDIVNKSIRPFLFTILNNSLYQMHVISSKWELGLVHYIAKFTISRFVISRFECTTYNFS